MTGTVVAGPIPGADCAPFFEVRTGPIAIMELLNTVALAHGQRVSAGAPSMLAQRSTGHPASVAVLRPGERVRHSQQLPKSRARTVGADLRVRITLGRVVQAFRPCPAPSLQSPASDIYLPPLIPMPLPRLTPIQWLICAIASLGFAFDIYEVLMAPLVVGPAIAELTGAKPGHAAIQLLGRSVLLVPGAGWRRVRPAGRLSHRPLRPPARAGLEHPALRVLGVGRRDSRPASRCSSSAVDDLHRCVRRVRGGRGVDRGAVRGPEAARVRARLYAGVLVDRRHHGHGRVRRRRHLRRQLSRPFTARIRHGATR